VSFILSVLLLQLIALGQRGKDDSFATMREAVCMGVCVCVCVCVCLVAMRHINAMTGAD
jgi:hypothetical protein